MDKDDASTIYGDIIDLPGWEPKHHPRMAPEKRAAQFAPFAALTGHAEAVDETARRVEDKVNKTGKVIR